MTIRLDSSPILGFETEHRYFHTTKKRCMIFNAMRILSYIPIIGTVCALIKTYYGLSPQLVKARAKMLYNGRECIQIQKDNVALFTNQSQNSSTEDAFIRMRENLDVVCQEINQRREQSRQDLLSIESNSLSLVTSQKRAQKRALLTQRLLTENIQVHAEVKAEREINDEKFDNAIQKSKVAQDLYEEAQKKYCELERQSFRAMIEGFSLGFVYILPDLYYTAWRPQNVVVVTGRAI